MGTLVNLAQRLEAMVTRRRKTNKDLSRMMAMGGLRGWNSSGLANASESVQHFKDWAFVAIDAIARNCSRELPNVGRAVEDRSPGRKSISRGVLRKSLNARIRKAMGDNETWEYMDSRERLPSLLANPNGPDVSGTFWYRFWMFVELTGFGYIWKERNDDGSIENLWVIPSQWVRPIFPDEDSVDGLTNGYQVSGFGTTGMATIPPEDMIVFRQPSPFGMIDATSRASAGGTLIDVNDSIGAARVLCLKNGANVGNVLTIPGASEEQITRMEARFQQKYTGEKAFNAPLILPEDATFFANAAAQETAMNSSAELSRKMIMAHWGVSETIIGISEGQTRATANAARANFAECTINPRLQVLGQVLTEQLAPEFGDDIEIWWDDQAPNDREMELAELTAASAVPGVLCPNDWRRWMDLDPWEDPAMDRPIMPVGAVPMGEPAGGSLWAGTPSRDRGELPSLAESFGRLSAIREAASPKALRNGVPSRNGKH